MICKSICKSNEHIFERIIDDLYMCQECGLTKIINPE